MAKDTGRLWPFIAAVWGLFAVIAGGAYDRDSMDAVFLVRYATALQLIAIWILVAMVIHQDALTDQRQFWLTRPYDRRDLLTAKFLFCTAFVYLPIMLMQVWFAVRWNVPVLPALPSLMFYSLKPSLLMILPALAIAVLTSSLRQFIPVMIGIVGGAAILYIKMWPAMVSAADGLETTNIFGICVILLVPCLAIGLQFYSRRTLRSGVLLTAGLALFTVSWFSRTLMALPSSAAKLPIDPGHVSIEFDTNSPVRMVSHDPPFQNCAFVPLRIRGVPRGATLVPRHPHAMMWNARHEERFAHIFQNPIDDTGGGYAIQVCAFQPEALQGLLRLDVAFEIRTVEKTLRFPAQRQPFAIGRNGHCEIGSTPQLMGGRETLNCRMLLPSFSDVTAGVEYGGHRDFSRNFLSGPGSGQFGAIGLTMFPGASDDGPGLEEALRHPGAQFIFLYSHRAAVVQTTLTYPGLKLTP
ncbi:MAG TPA: hypothetical protein VHC90_01865 [Bryobacteraceae bacterium]|nr:hypothetical protein [Bryobacteraceae bacterium]